jgi:hypothetical protein
VCLRRLHLRVGLDLGIPAPLRRFRLRGLAGRVCRVLRLPQELRRAVLSPTADVLRSLPSRGEHPRRLLTEQHCHGRLVEHHLASTALRVTQGVQQLLLALLQPAQLVGDGSEDGADLFLLVAAAHHRERRRRDRRR